LASVSTSPDSFTRMETRQRLLEAAGEVFAERGFRDTTIREICHRAQANLAAVNYHFRDKESLYTAVMKYASACAMEKYPLAQGESEEMPAVDRLHAFILRLLFSVLDKGAPAWLGKLMAREMIEPTQALDDLVKSIIFPMTQKLGAIVRELLGGHVPDDLVHRCQISIIGQCLHYRNARPVIQRVFPEHQYLPEDIAKMADHITRFSLAALRGLAKSEDSGIAMPGSKGLP
jgi:AcrR family transcriptional regulator